MQSAATKKTQGLSFNTIVLAVIALLVLIVIILFVTGGAARFSQSFRSAETTDIEDARNQCRLLCSRVKLNAQSAADLQSSEYCQKAFAIDVDKDGTLSNPEKTLQCMDGEIGIPCSIPIAESSTREICKAGCRQTTANPLACAPERDATYCSRYTGPNCPGGCKAAATPTDPCVVADDAACKESVLSPGTKLLAANDPAEGCRVIN